jgi:multimeric flavodoxin WrbA
MPKVLVLYYSAYGHLETMAQAVAEGRISSQMATFLDQAGGLWMKGALSGKVGGAFASTATQHGGQETTLFSIITNLLHFGMVVVGLQLPGPDARR